VVRIAASSLVAALRPHRRKLAWVAGAAALLAVVLAVPRDRPPGPGQLSAPLARLASGAYDADRNGAFDTVSGLQRSAAASAARQGRRPPLLRNYDEARSLLGAAEAEVDRALEAGFSALESERAAALDRVELARRALAETRQAGNRARLQGDGRRALKRQELLLAEAERNLARGAYGEAVAKSESVLTASLRWRNNARRTLARLADADALRKWQDWVDETVEWSRRQGAAALVVDKSGRRLLLYESGRLMATFQVELGLNPVPDKLHEGDNATPEGRYKVTQVRAPGETRYHRALMLDYPNDEDWRRFREARRQGRLAGHVPIGGLIEIHGYGGRGEDWTNGCVALTNREMDFLVGWVEEGTPVTIVGALEAPLDLAEAAGAGSPAAR
jgi:hypothetical protein